MENGEANKLKKKIIDAETEIEKLEEVVSSQKQELQAKVCITSAFIDSRI